MWYGFANYNKTRNIIRRWNALRNTKILTASKKLILPRQLSLKQLNFITLTSEFKFVQLLTSVKSNPLVVLYLYNNIYFLNLCANLKSKIICFEPQTCNLAFSSYILFPQWLCYMRNFNSLLTCFTRPYFSKLNFRGKGYYLYKNFRNVVTPQFGYSHRIYFYHYSTSSDFLSKTKILFFSLSRISLLSISKSLKNIKPINVFTGRGLRFSRQIVHRKTGKVSTYR